MIKMAVPSRTFCNFLQTCVINQVRTKYTFSPVIFCRTERGSFAVKQSYSLQRSVVQLSRHGSTMNPIRVETHPTSSNSDSEREKFLSVFPDIVRDLAESASDTGIEETKNWITKVVQYNVPGGKLTRGLTVVHAYHMLTPDGKHTEEDIYLAKIMGWCVELLQAFFIVLDDIMDKSTTRRGRSCWYLNDDIGLRAVNDGVILECAVYNLLKKYFGDKSYYLHVQQLFHYVTFKTTMGQSLDLMTSQAGKKPDYRKFTMDRYNAIVKYKTAYYSFYLPVALALHMVGIKNVDVHRQIKTILLEMGHFFQIQDDYLDCFGNPEVTGKAGSDISTGKCSWLAVTALQQANDVQDAAFKENYASDDEQKVATIKALYEELGLQSTYARYEKQTYESISNQIKLLPREIPHNVFTTFLKIIYKRSS